MIPDSAGQTMDECEARPLTLQSYESDDHSSECSTLSGVGRSSSDAENPLKLRECAMKRAAGIKGQKMCCYQLCPSPLHSKKWRVVTPGTSAGARDWNPLVGQTLCDSCYSTYRKHGTFIRSVRTTDGWIRVDSSGAQPANVCVAADKPRKSPAMAKRPRLPDADAPNKRYESKAAVGHDGLDADGMQVPLCPMLLCVARPCVKVLESLRASAATRPRACVF
jgi:hypothetical protein